MIRNDRDRYYDNDADLRVEDEYIDDEFDGYEEDSEYEERMEESDYEDDPEYDDRIEASDYEDDSEYEDRPVQERKSGYENAPDYVEYVEEPSYIRTGYSESEYDEDLDDEYEEESQDEYAEADDTASESYMDPRFGKYDRSSQEDNYGRDTRKGYVRPTGHNRFEDIKLTDEEIYDDEEDGGEYASSGAALKIAIALAAAVLVLVGITVVSLVMFKKNANKPLPGAADVVVNTELMGAGAQLGDIDLIGKQGLLAALDAKRAEVKALEIAAAEEEEEEEIKEYNEGEIDNDVTISLETVTVLKDLKVKVINKKTGKLLANIPFSVTVSYPDGSSKTWTDDDKDGIIYYTDLKAGKYKVHFNELTDEKYAGYVLPTDVSADVKDKIEYKAVDVDDEILDASQVNENKEDTARGGADTGGEAIANTVEWVESTTKEVYVEVDKSKIALAVPVASLDYAGARTYRTTADGGATDPATTYTLSLDPQAVTIQPQGTATVTATVNPAGPSVTWTSGNEAVATVSNGTITGVAAGTTTVTATVDGTSTSQTVQVTVEAPAPTAAITIAGTASVVAGKSAALGITYTGMDKSEISISSSDATVATASVSADGTTIVINGLKAGTATLTLSKSGGAGLATVTVTVTQPNYGIALGKATVDLYSGKSATIAMTLTNLDTSKIAASSNNNGVATVTVNSATQITVTAAAVTTSGSATITIQKSDDPTIKTTITVNVVGSGTAIKTADGKDVFVANSDGTYRAATYGDYVAGAKLFVKDKTYTGWQTINGQTYYYKADGTYVTGEQVIQGVVYNFDSKGCLQVGGGVLGIDVSKWNGSINWSKVKEAGVSFVIIRIGYRGSTKGGLIDDSAFKANIEGASNAGLKVGVYWVTQAVNEVEAIEEASAVLSRISGYRVSYPVFLDVESSGGRGDAIDKATRTVVCKTFCQTIQNSGYTAGIYANKNWMTNYIDASQLTGYKIWVAQYYKECTYKGSYSMWQYSDSGSINGISGKVDLNLSYLGY